VIRKALLLTTMLAVGGLAQATPVLTENFDNIATLSGSGWGLVNNSSPLGDRNWFQGNDGVFSAQSGAANSYIAANFENAAFGGNISNWLLTPTITLANDVSITFLTRTELGAPAADRLEVRLSHNGASGDVGADANSVGDFSTLLASINPLLDLTGYPSDWTAYTVNISGVTSGTLGRLAFRYFVPDTFVNGDYIGIDSVLIARVPEPGTLWLFAVALLAIGFANRRKQLLPGARL